MCMHVFGLLADLIAQLATYSMTNFRITIVQ